MSVKLRKRKNADSTTTLYLDIYNNGKRYYEFLKHLKLIKIATPKDRVDNKDNYKLAEDICVKRAQELESSDYNVMAKFKSKVDFLQYYQNFIDRYTNKDKRVIVSSLSKFKEFMKDEGYKTLALNQVTESVAYDFKGYLEHSLHGESPANYFSKFKKVIKQACRDKLIMINPTTDITIKRNEGLKKEVLTIEDIHLLAATPITNEYVKKAFLFSCLTGLRFCDIVAMKWKHIDLNNQRLSLVQSKTGHKVTVNLHVSAIQILGEPGNSDLNVFTLPSHTACTKDVKHWVKKAGISKHITWHCARHSFATNLIFLGADITTASNLLGHTTLKYTQRYTRVVNDMKRTAIDSMPAINF